MVAVKGQKIEAKYDGEKLYALIKEGKAEKEIMTELGVQSKSTFNNHLLKLMKEKKEFYEIPGSSSRTRSSSPVYRGGKIVISANMLTGFEFADGQKFKLVKTDDGLKLLVV